ALAKEALVAEPLSAGVGPGGTGMVVFADAEVVGAPGVYMHLCRRTRPLQGEIHQHAVLGWADNVFAAMREEDRRSAARNAKAGSEFILILGLQVTGIDRNG